MKSQSILVRFPGYPFSFEALMPDHELASTAACLLAEGHETVIRDFGTVGLVDRLFPEEMRATTTEMADRFLDPTPPGSLRALHMLWQIRAVDHAYQTRQVACCEELAEKLAQPRHTDFVAIKIDHPDDFHAAILLAKRIRQHDAKVHIVAFGRIADLYGRQLISTTTAFDCVCVGDPEVGLTALANNIHRPERWPSLPNLILPGTVRACHTQREYVRDLDALPEPVYDAEVYRALRNNRKLKLFPIEESRGCDSTCNNCPEAVQEGGLRIRSASRITAQMRRITAMYGAETFQLAGMGASMAHAAEVARAILDGEQKVVYSRDGNLPTADAALLPVLKGSGCVAISFRIGTGSQRLLRDYFGQAASISGIEHLLRRSKETGLATVARFVYPTPADDHHTHAETLRLIERTLPHAGVIEMPEVWPRTPWYQQPWQFGFGISFGARLDKLLRTRSRLGTPPGRWRSLPYRIGALSSTQVIQSHETMIHEVESFGVAACMLNETPLVARVLGWHTTLVEFRNEVMRRFLTGDVHGIARMVKDFNARSSKGAEVAQEAHLRAAVGN